MDTDILTKEDTTIEDAFESTPEEVKEFLSSNIFDLILLGIKDGLVLTDAQFDAMELATQELVIRTKTMQEVAVDFIESKAFTPELTAKVLYAIEGEVMSRIYTIIDTSNAEDAEQEESAEKAPAEVTHLTPVTAPSPADMLARLNQTLTTPTATAPTRRDYSATKEAPMIDQMKTVRNIDPYRELPDTK